MHISEENKVKHTHKERILLVHNYYKIPGGEDTVVENEKKLLEEHGHMVFFYCRKNSEMEKFTKLQKIFLPLTTIFNVKTYIEIKNIIKKEKIDIVHVHNTLCLISPSVYYAALNCKVPVVQTIHNFRMSCPAATFYRDGHICEDCMEKGLLCAVKHRCYRKSRLQTLICVITTKLHRMLGIYYRISYICLAEFSKQKLFQLNHLKKKAIINSEKVYIKPNMTFENTTNNCSERKSYYVFSGRVEKIKGIDLLLTAFSKLQNEHLIIAGTGTQFEYYKALAAKMKLNNVTFLGFIDKQQLKELVQNAKAVIVPSQWYEVFGMTIIEAFAMKTPVIGADIGNISNLIEEGVNGWKFHYNSSDDLVKKIIECSATPENKLNVYCKENNFPEGNYNELIQIYTQVSKQ